MTEVLLHVGGYPDSDDEERADLASSLRVEMLEHGVDHVSRPPVPPPPGAKGAGLEWAQLAVGLAGSLGPMITAIQAWTSRHPRAAVSLEIEGDTLTLDEASPVEQRRLVETFLARHGTA